MDFRILTGRFDAGMDGVSALVGVEFSIVLLGDITAFVWMLRVYFKNRRVSALSFSLAWLFDAIAIALSASPNVSMNYLGYISITIFSALIFYGAVRFLDEEGISILNQTTYYFSLIPPALMAYLLLIYLYTGDAVWTVGGAAALGIASAFVIVGGFLLRPLKEIYPRIMTYLYGSIILFGIHLIPAAIFGYHKWYLPIGFLFSASLIVAMVWALFKLTSTERFNVPVGTVPHKLDLKRGVLLIDVDEYKDLKGQLSNFPALAFLRDLSDVPKAWQAYFVTAVPFKNSSDKVIPPTNLAKMTELAFQYSEGFKKAGGGGVMVMDCIEYLRVYNSWSSLLKFLSKLRDFALVSRGSLIVVIDRDSFEETKYAQLVKLME